ncbi:MAG: hypothetical protein ACREBV_02655 [Candidatus Zixiibacteriota bacterium]
MAIKNLNSKVVEFLAWAIAFGAISVLPTCDKPFEPVGVLKDYPAYFFDLISNDSNWYFVYHPTANTIDSIYLPYASLPIVSADGKKLYIQDSGATSVAVLETDSFTVIDRLPYEAVLSVSPDNQLIFARKNGMNLLKTSDYSVIYQDSRIGDGRFSKNSKRLYGLSNTGRVIHRIEISDSVFESAQFNTPFGVVRDLEPSKDESKLLLYLVTTFGDYFAVHDIALDSIIFLEAQQPGYGEMEITPNGRYVFYTDPGQGMLGIGGPGWISVYDVACNRVLTRITTEGVLDPPNQLGLPINEINITPDGRWLVALTDYFTSPGTIFTVDIKRLAVVKHTRIGNGNLQGLTVQNEP